MAHLLPDFFSFYQNHSLPLLSAASNTTNNNCILSFYFILDITLRVSICFFLSFQDNIMVFFSLIIYSFTYIYDWCYDRENVQCNLRLADEYPGWPVGEEGQRPKILWSSVTCMNESLRQKETWYIWTNVWKLVWLEQRKKWHKTRKILYLTGMQ